MDRLLLLFVFHMIGTSVCNCMYDSFLLWNNMGQAIVETAGFNSLGLGWVGWGSLGQNHDLSVYYSYMVLISSMIF